MSLKILLLEDNPGDIRLVQESALNQDSIHVEWTVANRLGNALAQIQNTTFDLILLDLSLPDSQGIETFSRLQTLAPDLPIVILTGTDDEKLALEAVQKGAQDYLIKGQTPVDLLIRSLQYAIERHQLKQKLTDAQQKLMDAEKLRVLIETAGAAAHEINQPLTAIFGHVELILASDPQNPFRDDLLFIQEAAQRIREIVRNMGEVQQYQTKEYIGDTKIIDFGNSVSSENENLS